MELLRCPHCNHWRCFECADNSGLWLTCCKCGGKALAVQWYRGQARGRPHDLEHSPRLGTGRPLGASKPIVKGLIQFLECYGIPLNAFSRHTTISAWAIRQARACKRALSPRQELLINLTMQRIQAGKIWLRRKTRQRWELEYVLPSWRLNPDYIEPPASYKRHCPMRLTHCQGGLLPGSCYRRWKECPMMQTDWEAVERIHEGQAKRTSVKPP
jgi:hypothetical protein